MEFDSSPWFKDRDYHYKEQQDRLQDSHCKMCGHGNIISAPVNYRGIAHCLGDFQHTIQPGYEPEETDYNKHYGQYPFEHNPIIFHITPFRKMRVNESGQAAADSSRDDYIIINEDHCHVAGIKLCPRVCWIQAMNGEKTCGTASPYTTQVYMKSF